MKIIYLKISKITPQTLDQYWSKLVKSKKKERESPLIMPLPNCVGEAPTVPSLNSGINRNKLNGDVTLRRGI